MGGNPGAEEFRFQSRSIKCCWPLVHFSFEGKQNSSKSCLWGTGLAKGESVRGEINVLLKMMSNFTQSPGPSEACDMSHVGPVSALPPSLPLSWPL